MRGARSWKQWRKEAMGNDVVRESATSAGGREARHPRSEARHRGQAGSAKPRPSEQHSGKVGRAPAGCLQSRRSRCGRRLCARRAWQAAPSRSGARLASAPVRHAQASRRGGEGVRRARETAGGNGRAHVEQVDERLHDRSEVLAATLGNGEERAGGIALCGVAVRTKKGDQWWYGTLARQGILVVDAVECERLDRRRCPLLREHLRGIGGGP